MGDPRHLLVRADAHPEIGTGHVMRCLALCEEWRATNGVASLASSILSSSLREKIIRKGLPIKDIDAAPGTAEDALETISLAMDLEAEWIVADGYHFEADFQSRIKGANLNLLLIDDYGHAGSYRADIIVNQNTSARESLYENRIPDTELLLGTEYVLLRSEFLKWKSWARRPSSEARRLLITFGGADFTNFTTIALEALDDPQFPAIDLVVVVGGSSPHLSQIEERIKTHHCDCELLTDVDDMAKLMVSADFALAAGGSSCWEMAFMGLPAMLVITAENQRAAVDSLASLGAVINLGDASRVHPEQIRSQVSRLHRNAQRRELLSQKSRSLVDGSGAARVVERMRGKHRVTS